jgi:hypothetical protein
MPGKNNGALVEYRLFIKFAPIIKRPHRNTASLAVGLYGESALSLIFEMV